MGRLLIIGLFVVVFASLWKFISQRKSAYLKFLLYIALFSILVLVVFFLFMYKAKRMGRSRSLDNRDTWVLWKVCFGCHSGAFFFLSAALFCSKAA